MTTTHHFAKNLFQKWREMKYKMTLVLFFISMISITGQSNRSSEDVVLISENQKTEVQALENGALMVNVSPDDVQRLVGRGWVAYRDFGARGNGQDDDIDAIAAAHAFANKNRLDVKADTGATYYISGKERTVVVQTNTDFGTSRFIIDDTDVQNRQAYVFLVNSKQAAFHLNGISKLQRNQEKVNVSVQSPCLVMVTNDQVKRYIRFGLNQNNGTAQTDIFMIDEDGNVDMEAPIIWDFDSITEIKAIPLEKEKLTISGGRFTTVANQAESRYNYYRRGIAIRRSNVLIDGLEHRVVGEGPHGAPYGGFIIVGDCAKVRVQNTILTGHRTYRTIGSAGDSVSMGSYDIIVNRAIDVSFINCRQTNDIDDRRYWGIMGSNYSKRLMYDGCTFSRFDAHMGVANAMIRNSTLGHMGINAIGSGLLTVENSTIRGRTLINLRRDYGSTWRGRILIKNCVFVPSGGQSVTANLIGGFKFWSA